MQKKGQGHLHGSSSQKIHEAIFTGLGIITKTSATQDESDKILKRKKN